MLVTWRYRERNTIIQRLDPRTRFIFMLCMMFSLILYWDLRFILFFFVLAVSQMILARLTWQETKRFWIIITIITTALSLMTALTGRSSSGVYTETYPDPLWQTQFTLLGTTFMPRLSVERVAFLIAQIIRFFSFAALAVPIPFTIHPARYGIAFRRLGVPDKFAFATDLAFRFIPSLGQDFQLTMDAQKARGYEMEKLQGGLIAQVRKLAPLFVPVTIHALAGSEDIIDAMDLRGFGEGPRTWIEKLEFRRRDYALMAFGILLLIVSLFLSLFGYGQFWVPQFLIEAATSMLPIS